MYVIEAVLSGAMVLFMLLAFISVGEVPPLHLIVGCALFAVLTALFTIFAAIEIYESKDNK